MKKAIESLSRPLTETERVADAKNDQEREDFEKK